MKQNSKVRLIEANRVNAILIEHLIVEAGYAYCTGDDYDITLADINSIKPESIDTDKPVVFILGETDNISGEFGIVRKPVTLPKIKDALDNVKSLKVEFDIVDLDTLGNILGLNDHVVLKSIFEQYFISTESDIQKLEEAFVNQDYNELSNAAHSIKGASRNMRLNKLGKSAEKLEHTAKSECSAECRMLIDGIIAGYEAVKDDYKNKYS